MPDSASAARTRGGTPAATREQTTTIGPSTFVKGRIEGNDDLLVQGRLEGKVKLPKSLVIIASSGRVKADIMASSIQIKGHVHGKLEGAKEVVVRAGGRVEGDILAPRVSLDSGAQFRGSIDMGDDSTPEKPSWRAAGGS